jgi:hypothetical protein
MRSASKQASVHNVNSMSATMDFAPQNLDAGITVPGSESNQQFQNVSGFTTESQSEVIILHLVGTNQKSQPVKKAITVLDKLACLTCLKVNKSSSKFCSQCGTALEII